MCVEDPFRKSGHICIIYPIQKQLIAVKKVRIQAGPPEKLRGPGQRVKVGPLTQVVR